MTIKTTRYYVTEYLRSYKNNHKSNRGANPYKAAWMANSAKQWQSGIDNKMLRISLMRDDPDIVRESSRDSRTAGNIIRTEETKGH